MDTPNPKPRKGLALGSAAVGAVAILGSLLAFSGGAGAQDAPELTDPVVAATDAATAADDVETYALEVEADPELEAAFAAYDNCLETELGIDFETADEDAWTAITDEAWNAADDACSDLLPEEFQLDGEFGELIEDDMLLDDFFIDPEVEAEWAAYDECLQNELGLDFESADETAWEALSDDAWTAADEACQDQLPQDVQDMNAAWKKYDDCLVANGVDFGDNDVIAASVMVEDGDELSFAEFGEADGTITITQVDGEISLATDGDVEVIDFEDFEVDETWDAAHAACEGELPEDAFFDEIMPLDDEDILDLGDDMLIAPAKA